MAYLQLLFPEKKVIGSTLVDLTQPVVPVKTEFENQTRVLLLEIFGVSGLLRFSFENQKATVVWIKTLLEANCW